MFNSIKILPGNAGLRMITITVVKPNNPAWICVDSPVDFDLIITELIMAVDRP
jgi:hypothetical protein